MDWREFMRGFFGNRPTPPPPPAAAGERKADHWPPPLPIPDFQVEDDQKNEELNSQPHNGEGFFWGERNRRTPNIDGEGGIENFGNRFVFGDLFSAMGEMFQEMERSMRDMESFIGGIDMEGHPKMIPFSGQDDLSPPPAIQDSPKGQDNTKVDDDNIRDFVLKESETSEKRVRRNYKHYIPAPNNTNEKVDHDLDELYQNSILDLSELPVPGTEEDSVAQSQSPKSLLPFGKHGGITSTFQKTYQTFSFKNGRWEGEIVKEDQNGKEVTRYYQDKDGQRHETTEYFPKDGPPSVSSRKPELMDPNSNSLSSPEPPRIFQFFERFFKPRM